jgi:DNA repair protein RecO (recombination protein O)
MHDIRSCPACSLAARPRVVGNNGSVQGYRDDGVVLRTQKLGEADRIITLLTRHNGRVRAVARGVRRTKSRWGARLEPFTHVDVLIYPGRSLDQITQAEVIRPYGAALVSDYPKYTAGTAMLETAERFTPVEKEPAIRQFLLLIGGLRALGNAIAPAVEPDPAVEPEPDLKPDPGTEVPRDPRMVLDAYFLRSLTFAGYAPALEACARCGAPAAPVNPAPVNPAAVNPAAPTDAAAAPGSDSAPLSAPKRLVAFAVPAGGMVCADCRPPGAASPAPPTVALMIALLRGDWDEALRSERRQRVECSGLVAAYLQWHLEHSIRSLRHVERA